MKMVKISDCWVSSFLKTFPACQVSRHGKPKRQNSLVMMMMMMNFI